MLFNNNSFTGYFFYWITIIMWITFLLNIVKKPSTFEPGFLTMYVFAPSFTAEYGYPQ
jgi:hypothetical protein